MPIGEAPVPTDAAETADEPFFEFQWDKQVQNIPDAHDVTRGGGTRISIIDTGIDASHPDLAPVVNTDLSRNFTDDGCDFSDISFHGTHVSGIAAAYDRNDVGVVGTAPATDLVACRVFSGPFATFGDILAAIVYSVEIDADAANMSLGAYPVPRQGLGSFYGGLNRTTTFANLNGTLLVAAAGNDSANLQQDRGVISLPNEAANVMSISATGPIGFMWGDEGLEEPFVSPVVYTNYGTNAISVGAPGGDADIDAIGTGVPWFFDLVLNTILGGWGWVAGTSMAAPQVTGAAALVKSVNSNFNANQVRQTLERTAEAPAGFGREFYGARFLNPSAAVR